MFTVCCTLLNLYIGNESVTRWEKFWIVCWPLIRKIWQLGEGWGGDWGGGDGGQLVNKVKLWTDRDKVLPVYNRNLKSCDFTQRDRMRADVLTSASVAALQPVSLFAIAQPVDEGAELAHVLHPAGYHHLLLNQVRLRQVRPSLQRGHTKRCG